MQKTRRRPTCSQITFPSRNSIAHDWAFKHIGNNEFCYDFQDIIALIKYKYEIKYRISYGRFSKYNMAVLNK